MIHKTDALAALDESLRTSDSTEYYVACDTAARQIIEAMFGGRDRISLVEARTQNSILTLASCGFLGAIATALNAGDAGGDEEGRDASGSS
jgi:hypothetical protein